MEIGRQYRDTILFEGGIEDRTRIGGIIKIFIYFRNGLN